MGPLVTGRPRASCPPAGAPAVSPQSRRRRRRRGCCCCMLRGRAGARGAGAGSRGSGPRPRAGAGGACADPGAAAAAAEEAAHRRERAHTALTPRRGQRRRSGRGRRPTLSPLLCAGAAGAGSRSPRPSAQAQWVPPEAPPFLAGAGSRTRARGRTGPGGSLSISLSGPRLPLPWRWVVRTAGPQPPPDRRSSCGANGDLGKRSAPAVQRPRAAPGFPPTLWYRSAGSRLPPIADLDTQRTNLQSSNPKSLRAPPTSGCWELGDPTPREPPLEYTLPTPTPRPWQPGKPPPSAASGACLDHPCLGAPHVGTSHGVWGKWASGHLRQTAWSSPTSVALATGLGHVFQKGLAPS